MKTNVIINVRVTVPIQHEEGAVESFVEKLAKDVVSDALHGVNKDICIEDASASASGLIQG